MSQELIEAITPDAAALVCAVLDDDRRSVATILNPLDRESLYALAILLAANVADDSGLQAGAKQAPKPALVVQHAIHEAAVAFGTSPEAILSTARHRAIGEARQVAMAACRLSGMTSVAIGEAFGRDHSTVLHAATRVGESERLRRIAKRIAGPWATGFLGDELEAS